MRSNRPIASGLNSNPGIRRPRWGGVVEGVAGQIRHPLAYDKAGKRPAPAVWPAKRGAAIRAGIDPLSNHLDLV